MCLAAAGPPIHQSQSLATATPFTHSIVLLLTKDKVTFAGIRCGAQASHTQQVNCSGFSIQSQFTGDECNGVFADYFSRQQRPEKSRTAR